MFEERVALDCIHPDPHLSLFNSRTTRQQIYTRSGDTFSLRTLVQGLSANLRKLGAWLDMNSPMRNGNN